MFHCESCAMIGIPTRFATELELDDHRVAMHLTHRALRDAFVDVLIHNMAELEACQVDVQTVANRLVHLTVLYGLLPEVPPEVPSA